MVVSFVCATPGDKSHRLRDGTPVGAKMCVVCNYLGSRSLSLSKVGAGSATRFGFDKLSRR